MRLQSIALVAAIALGALGGSKIAHAQTHRSERRLSGSRILAPEPFIRSGATSTR